MFVRSIFTGLALSVALAAPAGAATFTAGPGGLLFTAAPGVENDLTIHGDPGPPSALVISTSDDPIPYSAEKPLPEQCSDADGNQNASPASAVQCNAVTAPLTIDLGDGSDRATGTGTTSNVTILGGPGHDTLKGGAGGQVLDGGADSDRLEGEAGADRLVAGGGDDYMQGGPGADVLEGGDGDNLFDGGAGDDVSEGGPGDDYFFYEEGDDTVRAGDGQDTVSGGHQGAPEDYDGGAGIDALDYRGDESVDVDLVAGVAKRDGVADVAAGFEDVIGSAERTTLSGTPGPNGIAGGYGADVVDPRAGNDFVSTYGGDDTVEARDGFADRVACGAGVDTVRADTLDDVQPDCENVTRTDAGNANDTPEDKAPTVAITAPATSALLSTIAPNTITADAADDKGIARVVFSTGERTLCTDETAPYTCDYSPTSADVGRDTLVVIAVDTAGQTASAVRVVSVPRFKATSLTAVTTPKRDRRAPFTFTTKGKLALPAGVLPAAGCKGTVDVSFKAGKKTVSSRRVALKGDCGYSSKVTFRLPRRLNPKTLSVVVVYGGNEVVEGINAKRHTVRPR